MVRIDVVLVAAALSGCIPAFETIDEACAETLRGQKFAEEGAEPFLRRLGCYRRYVGLPAVRVDEDVQRATRGHADYLERNKILDSTRPVSVFEQNASMPGYTGTDAISRLNAQGALDDSLQLGVWQSVIPHGDETVIDYLAEDPFYRDLLFQPRLDSIGYSIFRSNVGPWAYFNAIFQKPADRHVYKPIVYPIDGQTDVPAAFITSGDEGDPLWFQPVIGFPITVTVGAWELGTNHVNPYDLFSERATLTGPEGEIDLVSVPPGYYPASGDLTATMIYAPVRALTAGSTYTFVAEINWSAFPTGRTVTSTFTVAEAPEPAEPDTDVTDPTVWAPPAQVAPPSVVRFPVRHVRADVSPR